MRNIFVLCAAAALAVALSKQAAASPFPSANVGDPFTGSFLIDPVVPALPPPSNPGQYFGQIGTVTVNIGGGTFVESFTTVVAPVGYGSYSWYAGDGLGGCCAISLNGTPLGGYISTFLYGSTTSTGAILPQSLPAYTSSYLEIATGDGVTYAGYDGFLTSLFQVNPSAQFAQFAFTGTLSSVDIHLVAGDGGGNVGAVPEPSTWAMMLIGFACLGCAAYRRTRKNAIALVAG
jgi:hypothetical protein